MKLALTFLAMVLGFSGSALANVTVTSPVNNSTVGSTVHFAATATSPTCAKGVSSIGLYINNSRVIIQNGATLNTSVTLADGYYTTTVQEWDGCSGSTSTKVNISVGSGATGKTTAVTVTSPKNNSTVTSPVTFSATATTASCVKGIAAVGVYVDNVQLYKVNGTVIQTSQVIKPGAHKAVLQAWDNCGGSFTTTETMTVSSSAATAATVSVSASPASIAAGASSTLKVTAANATKVVLTGSNGSSYSLATTGGSETVTPTATTTYTATATGATGNVTSTATVTVAAAAKPTVSVAASPASVASGASSVLTVAATNATKVVIAGSNGTSYTLATTGGKQTVTPTATTTYTVTATGAGGTATSAAKVTVTAATSKPTATIAANPASITAGASSSLTVTATNATKVAIAGSDGTSYTLATTGGSVSVHPAATATYTVTATGAGGTATSAATVTVVAAAGVATVSISANPASIAAGGSSSLTVAATNATKVTITGTDGTSYTLATTGGSQTVTPSATTTYTATATGSNGNTTAVTTVSVGASAGVDAIQHVVFMLQENHSFDNYFGMLNPYRAANGWNVAEDGLTYAVDGIEDKLTKLTNSNDEGSVFSLFKFKSTCIDDETSAFEESYGDVSRYNFGSNRSYPMDGFVHTAENFAKNCSSTGSGCGGSYTDLNGQRSMGYYDQDFLNYYYYMASQFALSDRWFTPISSKSIDNRIATFSGGTTQGLVADPGNNDHLGQLNIPTIFSELAKAGVSWKIYYTVTQGECLDPDDCPKTASARFPGTNYSPFAESYKYLNIPKTAGVCTAPAISSNNPTTGDTTGSFCVDPTHIAPLSQYYTDLANKTLPAFAFIEAGYGHNDEHPGSGQSVLSGQAEVANVVNAFMNSPSWSNSAFFLAYDEGGGPYDHVPPVPGHSNQNTNATLGSAPVSSVPDISSIAVDADSYGPCLAPGGVPSTHCDLPSTSYPGGHTTDAAAVNGFAAQLGFRVPNMVISPFTRKHYVSHVPMDHTAILKFVENRFIGPTAHLTARDAAQPGLLDFFDFNAVPWAAPPTPPAPVTQNSLGYNPCTPQTF